MVVSMTGFAALRGQGLGHVWGVEIRSVNGKGLDLRLRVPDWVEGLEAAARAALGTGLVRGNVSLTIKLARDEGAAGAGAFALDPAALAAALAALTAVEAAAMAAGVTLAQPRASDVLHLRGVLTTPDEATVDSAALRGLILADLDRAIAALQAMRGAEGAGLARILTGHLDQISDLTRAAEAEAAARRATGADTLREAMARLLASLDQPLDEARLAQELALLALRQDVQEEIDRLNAHVAAARSYLAQGQAMGRKLDFLTQEFMREANTLCSKAQSLALTRIGLDLKAVIDQMREQVQNVE